jgi:regulatory protein
VSAQQRRGTDGEAAAVGSGRNTGTTPRDPVSEAQEHCLRLLTARPRTRAELAKALSRKGLDDDVAERVLARFDDVGLIDDRAFAEQWVRSRHNYSGLARRALVTELQRKGIDSSVAAAAATEVDPEAEEQRARELVRRRMRGLAGKDETTMVRRLVGILARKGYPEGLAYRVVREELSEAGQETDLLDDVLRE